MDRLVGHQACSNEIDWKVEQLLFLLHRGIFRQDSPNTIGNELAGKLLSLNTLLSNGSFSYIDAISESDRHY